MSRGIIPSILGKGWRFLGIGPLPLFWSLIVCPGTVMVLSLLMCYNQHILKIKF